MFRQKLLLPLPRIVKVIILIALCGFPVQPGWAEGHPLVLILSVDGLRPDVLLRSQAPQIAALLRQGSFTFYSKTTDLAVTLPSHVSMLTGVPPATHGITWNERSHDEAHRFPLVPTLFELAEADGLSTALVAGKPKFDNLIRNGAPRHSFVPQHLIEDREVAQVAARLLVNQKPTLLFVHLPSVDSVGHRMGWGSREQELAVSEADQAVGVVVKAFYGVSQHRPHYIILTSDHGGAGKGHGAGVVGSEYVPLLLVGPGVQQNFDLTLAERQVRIEDVFATSCQLLSLPMPPKTLGKSVLPLLGAKERAGPVPHSWPVNLLEQKALPRR